jgi:hypothetical protein
MILLLILQMKNNQFKYWNRFQSWESHVALISVIGRQIFIVKRFLMSLKRKAIFLINFVKNNFIIVFKYKNKPNFFIT